MIKWKKIKYKNKRIEEIIERHHNKIQLFSNEWSLLKNKSIDEIQSWLYDFILFLSYHFYTEEFFMSNLVDVDQHHMMKHRDLLNSACLLLIRAKDLDDLIGGIETIFDVYLTQHLEHVDPTLNYNVDEGRVDYFLNDEHCGIIVLQFKKGFITVFYGKLSGDVLRNYFQYLRGLIPKFSGDWMKIVDLSRWDLTTFDAVEVAIERNKTQHEMGCQSVLYFTQDDPISRFVVDKIASTSDHIHTCFQSDKMLNSDLFSEIVSSKLIDVKVIASNSFILNYYNMKYPDVSKTDKE